MKKWIVNEQKCQTGNAYNGAAQINQTFSALKGKLVIAGANFFSNENRGCIGKTAKECNDKTFHSTKDSDGSDCLFTLTSQNNVNHHISNTNQNFVADDWEALDQVILQRFLCPAKMFGKFQDKWNPLMKDKSNQN